MKEAIKAKSDTGKPKLSLVPTKIIFAIEKIRSYGNAKYPDGGKDNWKTVEPDRHFEAMLRHAAKCWNDPYAIDPESGLPHMFHMACDMAFFIDQNWDNFENTIKHYNSATTLADIVSRSKRHLEEAEKHYNPEIKATMKSPSVLGRY